MSFTHNFNQFYNSYKRNLKKWDNRKIKVMKGIALQCLADLQYESPVLTGRYRAAHTLSIDEQIDWLPSELGSGERTAIIAQNEPLPMSSRMPHEDYLQIAEDRQDDALTKLSGLKPQRRITILIQNNVEYNLHVEARDHPYAIVQERYDSILRSEIRRLG